MGIGNSIIKGTCDLLKSEQGTSYIDELFRKKGEIQQQLSDIELQIREHIENEYKGKLETAMSLLDEIYDGIPSSKEAYIDTSCDRCEDEVIIDLDDALDKIRYVFNKLIKQERF